MADVCQRERDPDETNRRMCDRNRHVQHVDLEGVAVTLGAAKTGGSCLDDLGTPRMILHGRHALERLGGVAEHSSVRGDERHARAGEDAEVIGFRIELRHRQRRRAAGQQIGCQPRLRHKRRANLLVDFRPHRGGEQCAGDYQRDRRRPKRGQKELGLEGPCARRHCGSTTL